jgi:hypothetical protein
MAIWAALISVVGGGVLNKKSADAAEKGIAGASGNINAASKKAIAGLQPYSDVGKNAFYQLAGLAGIEGYRTPEELAYTQHMAAKPKLGAPAVDMGQFKRGGLEGIIDKSEGISTAGDVLGGVTSFYGRRNRKKEREAQLQQAELDRRARVKYKKDLAAWESKGQQLKSVSETSIQTYSPTAQLEKTPGYQFRMQQGQKATNAMSSAQGDVLSGQGIKRLQENAQGLASQEYGNEFNRLLALSGIGQNATTTQGNIGIGAGTNLANLNVQQGQNQAQYYSNLNDLTQGATTNLAYLNARDNTNTGSSYDVNSPTSNPNYKPGQTLDPALYN